MTISILNQKGGVGKTTTAVNLAAALARTPQKEGSQTDTTLSTVLLIDLDAQANASGILGVRQPAQSIYDALVDSHLVPLVSVIVETNVAGVHLAPAHRALAGLESALRDVPGREMILRELLEPLANQYDYVLIDNGPSLGIAPAMSLCAANYALLAMQCQPLALEGLQQAAQTIALAQARLNPALQRRVVLTMQDGKKTGQRIAAAVQNAFADETCAAVIPSSEHLKNGVTRGGTVLDYAPNSTAASAFVALAQEVRKWH